MEFIFEDTETAGKRRPYSSNGGLNQSSSTIWSSPSESLETNSLTRRKSVPANASEVEIAPAPKRKRKSAKVTYLKNSKAPTKSNKRKKTRSSFVWTWNKVCWMVCFGVLLRLIFMDRGVVHYYQMQDTLTEKQRELEMVESENTELISEIHQIKASPAYQKKLAREHLGVIAKDEYLILFAKDGRPRSI